MLWSEFRLKYPNAPHNDPDCYDRYNWGIADPNSDKYQQVYHNINKANLSDVIKEYCHSNNLNSDQYLEDWRSIKRINPTTKQFYKSSKFK
jgi:hypothetical protein